MKKTLLLCVSALSICTMQTGAAPIPLPDSSDFTWVPGSNAIGIGNSATTASLVQNLAAAITRSTDLNGWFGGTGQGHSAGDYGSDIAILSDSSFRFLSRPRLSGEYVAAGVELGAAANRITLSFDYAGTIPAGQSTPTGSIGYSLWSYDATTSTATELIPFGTLSAGESTSQIHQGRVSDATHLIVIWNSNPPGGGGSGIVSAITLSYIPYATYVENCVNPTTHNGRAGVTQLQHALETRNPQVTAPGSGLARVLDAVDAGRLSDAGAAAVAGAATAMLGMAAHNDLNRQLQSIRNRTTSMGADPSVVNNDLPCYNIWANAEGNYDRLGSHGTESGYRLSSWGGTLGVDIDITPAMTAGSAVTAMYGELDATGSSRASGEFNTYYMSFFARYAPSAWTHTLIAAAGLADISLKRTLMGEEMEGDTSGMSFGLMYEVGRMFTLDDNAALCLQPVFNISWRHTHLHNYTEHGSNLALDVEHQSLNTVSLGLGTRMQAVVGENLYNRASLLECRVLARLDMGDRRNSATTTLAGMSAEVDSAKAGAFGLEAGAGLTIPLGEEAGSMFLDAAVELRSDYTHVYGTLGYHMSF